jgi:hypothetical protein
LSPLIHKQTTAPVTFGAARSLVPWIRFLVSDGWSMTGQTILVNGGYSTK